MNERTNGRTDEWEEGVDILRTGQSNKQGAWPSLKESDRFNEEKILDDISSQKKKG